jgi:hypothetical protein
MSALIIYLVFRKKCGELPDPDKVAPQRRPLDSRDPLPA